MKSSDDTVFLEMKTETFQEQGNKDTKNAATKKHTIDYFWPEAEL